MNLHIPVMLNETINNLNIDPNGIYVDLTLGRANHSKEILKKLDKGLLIGFDKDVQAIKESKKALSKISDKFKLIHSDFCELKNKLKQLEIKFVDGIIADLGISSPQVDDPERGFSYNKDSKLDMRMNQEQEISAFEIVNNEEEKALVKILKENGDVKNAVLVAKNICLNRPINTTLELVEIIKKSYPSSFLRKKNPSKNVFQAIRIEVNQEISSLEKMLKQVPDILSLNGTFVIITFHSLEDKIVKHFFKTLLPKANTKLPTNAKISWKSKQIRPSKEEIDTNKRSRSAKLRILRRVS